MTGVHESSVDLARLKPIEHLTGDEEKIAILRDQMLVPPVQVTKPALGSIALHRISHGGPRGDHPDARPRGGGAV